MDRVLEAARRVADYTIGTAIVMAYMLVAARLVQRAATAADDAIARRAALRSGAAA